jgi:hypothetical protein
MTICGRLLFADLCGLTSRAPMAASPNLNGASAQIMMSDPYVWVGERHLLQVEGGNPQADRDHEEAPRRGSPYT